MVSKRCYCRLKGQGHERLASAGCKSEKEDLIFETVNGKIRSKIEQDGREGFILTG
jgi:hypothetical protein